MMPCSPSADLDNAPHVSQYDRPAAPVAVDSARIATHNAEGEESRTRAADKPAAKVKYHADRRAFPASSVSQDHGRRSHTITSTIITQQDCLAQTDRLADCRKSGMPSSSKREWRECGRSQRSPMEQRRREWICAR